MGFNFMIVMIFLHIVLCTLVILLGLYTPVLGNSIYPSVCLLLR